MTPKLHLSETLQQIYKKYLAELKHECGFLGDVSIDFGSRLTMATDNSVYQVIPQAVCFPKNHADIACMMRLASVPRYNDIQFSPHGGGTGTNGQSLTSGIVIDCSRYMTRILSLDLNNQSVSVEPGVVLDELNAYLKPYNLFFAPSLSTGSRATLGGMFATDACGKGSCRHGRTSDHVISATIVLANGGVETIGDESVSYDKTSPVYAASQQLSDLIDRHHDEIYKKFSHLPRHITAYNLLGAKKQSGKRIDFRYLLSGSEGTLAIATKLTLRLTPIPKHTVLFAIKYNSFDDALRATINLMSFNPAAVETIDDKILEIAQSDVIYTSVQPMLDPEENDTTTKAINLVEFSGQDADEVDEQTNQLFKQLTSSKTAFYHTDQARNIALLWDLRKKSVGLLANLPGERQPVPFVEDTAVPPEKLPDFIVEFREILESYQLNYGMFGHADSGCLHVRPALNMKNTQDMKLLPEITQKVYQLVKKYQGIMWSEHGRGYRSEQTEDFFGETLYAVLREIKTIFDPYNQLNPGKIVSSFEKDQPIVRIDGPFRGKQDRQISSEKQKQFARLIKCNGNGACFQYSAAEVMCPSYHATRDRIHSPKGRSVLMREWLRLLSANKNSVRKKFFKKKINDTDFSTEVYRAMSGCLGCKGCATACPVQVDIPEYKSIFLDIFFKRYRRPVKDYFIAFVEYALPTLMRTPKLLNRVSKLGLQKKIGLVDLPVFSTPSLKMLLKKKNLPHFSLNELKQMNPLKTVCLVADPFVAAYQPDWVISIVDLIMKLGIDVVLLPIKPSGKPMHAKGFLTSFKKLAVKNNRFYSAISALGFPIVGIDPAITLCFRDEYQKTLGDAHAFNIMLLSEWLLSVREKWVDRINIHSDTTTYYLLSHCTEKSLSPTSTHDWQKLFSLFGLQLNIIDAGCCGMAGSFGHETAHQEVSKKLFTMSWEKHIQQLDKASKILVTGFSCACQSKRISGITLKHPATVLSQVLR